MDNQPPPEEAATAPPRRISFLRRWLGWWGGSPGGEPLSQAQADVPPPPPVLTAKAPTGRNAELAAAYAKKPEEPVAEPPTDIPLPAPPAWKVLEPEDQSDPVPHEVSIFSPRNESWNLLAASVRGKLHAHQAMWRDDAFALDSLGDWTILAVADGAGSAKISRIGAQIACEEAIKSLKGSLPGSPLAPGEPDTPAQETLLQLRSCLADAARHAQAGIAQEAERRSLPVREFSTTFLLVIHAPYQDRDFVGAIQVGDGAIGLCTADQACTVLGVPDHGAYSSETVFLTAPGIEQQFERRVFFAVKKGLRCLAIMSDGVADDFFPENRRLVELFSGKPIADLKDRQGNPVVGVMHSVVTEPRDGKALLEWLQYERKGSSDDRTLVLMYRSNGA